jgi:hypothetical protein
VSGESFQAGELVNVTIRNARVVNSYPVRRDDADMGTVLVAEYTNGEHRNIAVNLAAEAVTVERVAPAEWPPLPGDLWRSTPTRRSPAGQLWLACGAVDVDGKTDPYVPLVSTEEDHAYADDVLHSYGPLTLVHREPQPEPSTGDGA